MTTYASQFVTWDDLFDFDIIGDGPQAVGYASNSVPMKYAAIVYGTKRADIGYAINGVDVSNLWAAKGTAAYVNSDAGFPAYIANEEYAPTGPLTATLTINLHPDGTTTTTLGDTAPDGQWAMVTGAGVGAGYEVSFEVIATNGNGSVSGTTLGSYVSLSSTRSLTITVTRGGGFGAAAATRTIRIRFRLSGAVSPIVTRDVDLDVRAMIINEG